MEVKEVDKNAVVRLTDGTSRRVSPAGYGDPSARFENLRRRFEPSPSLQRYGLEGYRRLGKNNSGVLWTGARSNGEFFFIQASLAPEELPRPGITFPLCQSRYFSEKEDLFIAYRYPQDHIAKWREIDDAIWEKLREWRVK